MKALVYTEPRKFEFRDWPEPRLEPGEALVRVRAVAVCGSDVHGWLGHSRGRVPPLVLGHELSGVVEEVHDAGTSFKKGDRVAVYPLLGCTQCAFCNSGQDYICRRRKVLGLHVHGGFAELLKVPVKNLEPIPETTGFTSGALIEPLGCGLHTVRVAEKDVGAAAILGAGPIGLMTLLAARRVGFPRIAVVEVNPTRVSMARRLGADLVVNPQDAECLGHLERFFGEDGCFVVFDAAGFSPTRQLALRLVRTGGLVVSSGLGEQESPLDYVDLIRREVRLKGVFAYSRPEFQMAAEWMGTGHLDFSDWVSEAPLAEGQAVFEDLASPKATRIKVVLKP